MATYTGPNGRRLAFPGPDQRVWRLPPSQGVGAITLSVPLLQAAGAGAVAASVGTATIPLTIAQVAGVGAMSAPGTVVGGGTIALALPSLDAVGAATTLPAVGTGTVSIEAAVVAGLGAGASAAVPFASVDTGGWSVTYPEDITAASVIEQSFDLERQGFADDGTATTVPDTLVLTRRVLNGPPGGANPLLVGNTARQVALSDYIYAGDVISGAVNNSTEVSPPPIVRWCCEDRIVVGNSLYLAVVAAHRDARFGRQVRTVRFKITDMATSAVYFSPWITSPTMTAHTGWVRQCPAWQHTFDLAELGVTDVASIRADVEVVPWFGRVADGSIFRSEDVPATSYWRCRSIYFRRDVARATSPTIVVVNSAGARTVRGVSYGAGTTTVASVYAGPDPALARASPALNYAVAQQRLSAVMGADMAGGEIWIASPLTDTNPLDDTASRSTSGYALTIRRDPHLTIDEAVIDNLSGRLQHRQGRATELEVWKVRVEGLRFRRVSNGNYGAIVTTQLAGTLLDVWYVNCEMMNEGTGLNPIGGFATAPCRGVWFWGGSLVSDEGSQFTSRSSPYGTIQFYGFSATARTLEGANNRFDARTCIASSFRGYKIADTNGGRDGWNRVMHWHTTWWNAWISGNALFSVPATEGIAFVNTIIESTGDSERTLRIAEDNSTGAAQHVIIHNHTNATRDGQANGGMNMAYDMGALPKNNHRLFSVKNSIVSSMAWKGGEVAGKDGHYPHGHGVGFLDCFQANGTAFPRPYIGLGFRGTMSGSTDPQYVAPGVGSFGGPNGAGLGNYALQPSSGAKAFCRGRVTSHDLVGTERPAVNDSAGAFV